MTIQRRLRRLAALLPAACLCVAATGQLDSIDQTIVSANTIDAAGMQAIQSHAESWSVQLSDADPSRVAGARERLARPLRQSGVSVAFRRAYAEALIPSLSQSANGESVAGRLAALRVAGLLATDESLGLLVDSLASDDDATRLFAASQIGVAFAQANASQPAMSPEAGVDAVRALGGRLADAPTALEASAAGRALATGLRLTASGFDPVRNAAGAQLGSRAGERVRRMPVAPVNEEELVVALEACAAARAAVTANTGRPDREATKQLIGLGADVLAWALARFVENQLPPVDERELENQAVGAAENAIYFARQHDARLRGASPSLPTPTIARSLREGDDRSFRTAALDLLGSEGQLVREFGFAPNRFLERTP